MPGAVHKLHTWIQPAIGGIRKYLTFRLGVEELKQGKKPPNTLWLTVEDSGAQFVAKDFKEFIRISGMTRVRTSPHYPQSDGKIDRWHKSLKGECIRPGLRYAPGPPLPDAIFQTRRNLGLASVLPAVLVIPPTR